DLEGWEYRSLTSGDSTYTHRYYYYPSKKPDAPVFLLIHGLNLDGRTFLHMQPLAERWQLIAYDLPEQSPVYSGSFDDWMTIMYDFVEQTGLQECCLGAVSFGAAIAVRLAAEHPTLKTNNIVLMSTSMLGATPDQRRQSESMGPYFGSLSDAKLYWVMETMINRSKDDLPATENRDVRNVLRVKHPDFYRQVSLSLVGFNAGAYAKRIERPTLVVMGTEDDLYDDDHEKQMRSYIPHLEYRTIEGATHSMVYMHGEKVAAIVKEFCMRHCGFTWLE
ncbi:MAG: alpha/beta fold hydrolase, partial [Chitinivibrionales bacterium]|nr:alpha/beta fold hydrolase [Chitinivibrionales bacterium]